MKKLLAIIVSSLCFLSHSQANNIKEFQIDGISIGDSLLDHYTFDQIQKAQKIRAPFYHKDMFVEFETKPKKLQLYDYIKFTYKQNDKDFKLYGIAGIIEFPNDFNKCIETKKNAVTDIEKIFPDAVKTDYGKTLSVYDKSKKSYFIETNFLLKGGSLIRIYCENWSDELTKKNLWQDNLSIILNDILFLNFLDSTYN